MNGFALGVDQETWCGQLRALSADRLRPLAEKGEPGRVNRPLLAALGELGLLERVFTAGALELCLLRESLAYGCTEAETALALQGWGPTPYCGRAARSSASGGCPGCARGGRWRRSR